MNMDPRAISAIAEHYGLSIQARSISRSDLVGLLDETESKLKTLGYGDGTVTAAPERKALIHCWGSGPHVTSQAESSGECLMDVFDRGEVIVQETFFDKGLNASGTFTLSKFQQKCFLFKKHSDTPCGPSAPISFRLIPPCTYGVSFRFTKRAKRRFLHQLNEATRKISDPGIVHQSPSAIGSLILEFAQKDKDCLIILGIKHLEDLPQAGFCLIIDCLPVLRSQHDRNEARTVAFMDLLLKQTLKAISDPGE